ncbi:MAG: cytochrome C oxidase subunit IV family protein [Candidatus Latescibacterota bacterium]
MPEETILHEEPHVVAVRVYVAIFLILICGTALTVAASFVDMGPLNTPVALMIAVVKGTLVVLFFMHVRYGSRLIWLFAAGGAVWLTILLVLTLSDYMSRGWLGQPTIEFLQGSVPSPF